MRALQAILATGDEQEIDHFIAKAKPAQYAPAYYMEALRLLLLEESDGEEDASNDVSQAFLGGIDNAAALFGLVSSDQISRLPDHTRLMTRAIDAIARRLPAGAEFISFLAISHSAELSGVNHDNIITALGRVMRSATMRGSPSYAVLMLKFDYWPDSRDMFCAIVASSGPASSELGCDDSMEFGEKEPQRRIVQISSYEQKRNHQLGADYLRYKRLICGHWYRREVGWN